MKSTSVIRLCWWRTEDTISMVLGGLRAGERLMASTYMSVKIWFIGKAPTFAFITMVRSGRTATIGRQRYIHGRGSTTCLPASKTKHCPAGRRFCVPIHPWVPFAHIPRAGLLRLTGSAWMAPSMQARTESPIWCFAMNGFRRGMGKCALYL